MGVWLAGLLVITVTVYWGTVLGSRGACDGARRRRRGMVGLVGSQKHTIFEPRCWRSISIRNIAWVHDAFVSSVMD